MCRHLLILESDGRGHPLEWLQHLLRFLDQNTRDDDGRRLPVRLSLAVARELAGQLADWRPAIAGRVAVEVLSLEPAEQARCNHPNLSVAAFARWMTMRRYLRRTGADHGLFLGLDLLSLPLAFRLPIGQAKLSGILFRPSVHYPELGGYRPRLSERLRDLRKHVLYQRMLQHPALEAVYSLDPYFATYARTHYAAGGKVQALPDPAFAGEGADAGDRVLAESLPSGRTGFVLFGVLTERKGILALLPALDRLSRETAGQVAILIAGRVDPPIREVVHRQVGDLIRRRPELWLKLEDRHLSSGEITALVSRSDVVLAPYQRFVGSSGVMLWAARYGKPLLTQDYGLLGRLVREYRLGMTVNTSDPDSLADGIEAAVRRGPQGLGDAESMAAFVALRGPQAFAARILQPLLAGLQPDLPAKSELVTE